MNEPLPDWLKAEALATIEELPEDERAAATAILESGEYTLELFPAGGRPAVALDLGPIELLTCHPADVE